MVTEHGLALSDLYSIKNKVGYGSVPCWGTDELNEALLWPLKSLDRRRTRARDDIPFLVHGRLFLAEAGQEKNMT